MDDLIERLRQAAADVELATQNSDVDAMHSIGWHHGHLFGEVLKTWQAPAAVLKPMTEAQIGELMKAFENGPGGPLLPLRAESAAVPREPEWRAMAYAPRDGTEIEILFWHRNRQYCRDDERSDWEQVCRAHWIDHNSGGWTWHGIAGVEQGWRPLAAAPDSAAATGPDTSDAKAWADARHRSQQGRTDTDPYYISPEEEALIEQRDIEERAAAQADASAAEGRE